MPSAPIGHSIIERMEEWYGGVPHGKGLGTGFVALERWKRSDSERQRGLIECDVWVSTERLGR